MNQNHPLNQPYIRAKIIGIIPILIGLSFFLNPPIISNKTSIMLISIGSIWIVLVTEKSIFDYLLKIIKNYNLSGNAVFLPKSKILSEEKIYIPKENNSITIPYIDDSSILIKNESDKILGLSLLPSGEKLLKKIEKKVDLKDINIEKIEEKLEKFVDLHLFKSINLEKRNDCLKLVIEKPKFCRYDENICKQYPCPACSAVLTIITRAIKKKIRIKDIKIEGKKIIFDIRIEG